MSTQTRFQRSRLARTGLIAGLLLVGLAVAADAGAQEQYNWCGGHRQRACAWPTDTGLFNPASVGCDSGTVSVPCFGGLCAGTLSTRACIDPSRQSAYSLYRCGGANQRACTIFERYAGSDACRPGNDQVPCFGGLCAGTASTSACVSDYFTHFGCGGRGQRACTVFETAGRAACQSGLREVGPPCPDGVCDGTASITACVDPGLTAYDVYGCGSRLDRACLITERYDGSSACRPGLREVGSPLGVCVAPADTAYDLFNCGSDAKRACTIFERFNDSGACQEDLYEVPCFGGACQGTLSTSACTSDYFSLHGCGGDGQRACTIFERGVFQGNPACRPDRNLLEYACVLTPNAPEGVCGANGSISWCEYGFKGFARGSVPRQIVTTAGSEVSDLALGMTLGITSDGPAVAIEGVEKPTVDWGDGHVDLLAVPNRTPDPFEFPDCESCQLAGTHTYLTPGEYTIHLSHHENDLEIFFPRREATIPVTVKPVTDGEFIIASIGDSIASGEGVPNETLHWKLDPRGVLGALGQAAGFGSIYQSLFPATVTPWPYITMPARWDDGLGPVGVPNTKHPTNPSACHRSRWAGPAQAATQLQRENPNTLVRFFHEACTGTRADDEMLGQLETLRDTPVGGGQGGGLFLKDFRIDALLVSAGANDAGFGDLTLGCLNPATISDNGPGRCDGADRVALLNDRMATLPAHYQTLNNKIQETLPDVANVYITEYFDPTRDETGEFPGLDTHLTCTGDLMAKEEWQFMYNSFISPLNGRVRSAAQAHGWQLVDGIERAFRRHGFCAGGDRWAGNLFDSVFAQGDQGGTAHPNRQGHAFIADKIVKKIYGQNVPVTDASMSPAVWTNQSVRVSLAARGAFNLVGSRPQATFVGVDNLNCAPSSIGGCAAYTQPFTIANEGRHQVSFFSQSQGGVFEELKTVEAFIDKTPPSIAGVRSPAPNGAGWNNTEVTVSFDCSDALSGVARCVPAAYTLVSDGVSPAVNGEATDMAGNTATARVTDIKIDRTPPTIVASQTPVPNANGWNNTDVTVNFTCADVPSGIATCSDRVVASAEGAGQTIEGTAMDLAGNPAMAAVIGIKIDRTPPTVSGSWTPTPNANGWNNVDVTVTFACTDELSGLAAELSGLPACSPDAVVTAEGADQRVPGSATDRADNTGVGAVTGINLDRTRPTITATRATAANGHGWNNGPVTVSFACGDALSGVAACPQNVVIGTEGESQTADGTVSDRADNASTATVGGINIDRTPPAIAGSRAPLANAFGWNNSPVTVSFTCNDALSGIDGCTDLPQVVAEEGEAQARGGTAVDRAGNEADTSVGAISIDLTPPSVIGTLAPAPNVNGWNRTDVLASFECSDRLSGVATCSAPTRLTQEGGAHVVNGSAADRAGNMATSALLARIDKIAPELALHFDAASLDLAIVGRDAGSGVPAGAQPPLSVVPVPWHMPVPWDRSNHDDDHDADEGDDDKDEMNAELRTYRIVDAADNTVLVVVRVKRAGQSLQARLVELRYNDGTTVPMVRNRLRFEWAAERTGTLRRLQQDLEIGRGRDRREISADFDGRRNVTTVSAREDGERKSRRPGLVVIRLATAQGRLGIEY